MRPDLDAIRTRWEKRGRSFDDKDEFELGARTDIPALLAYVEKLETEVERVSKWRETWAEAYAMLESKVDTERADAYRRGAEAMREACAQWVADFCSSDKAFSVRGLPIPEEP